MKCAVTDPLTVQHDLSSQIVPLVAMDGVPINPHITTREKASSSAGFRPISSAGTRATNKALQLTYSSSAGPPALLLHKCCSSALKGTSLLLVAIARFPCARYCYNRAAANFSALATANFSSFLFFSAYLFCI